MSQPSNGPTDPITVEELARLGEELGVFSRRYYDWLADNLRPHAVNAGKRRVLRLLLEGGPLTMSALAAELHLDPKRMTRLVDELAATGFVERVDDPGDRRVKLVCMTDIGRETWASIEDTFVRSVAALVPDLSPRALDDLAATIRVLISRLGALEVLSGSK
jgi:DNA-binding MarR family transcriptional regulator